MVKAHSLQLLPFPSWNVISGSFAHRFNNLFAQPVCDAFVQHARSQHKVCCSCRNEALYDLACGRWILSWVDDDLYRAYKGSRVAFNFSAEPIENSVLVLKFFDCTKWEAGIIPDISIPRDHAQGELLPYSTNHDALSPLDTGETTH